MAIHPGFRENSFDCLLHSLMQRKRRLAASALWPMGDTDGDVGELQRMLKVDSSNTVNAPLQGAMAAMFARDGQPPPVPGGDGSIEYR